MAECTKCIHSCVCKTAESCDGYVSGCEHFNQGWIPVKDRLPKGECLAVSMLTGPAYKEMLIGYVGEAENWDTGYECESDGEILPNVTHWMPLPEAPNCGADMKGE